MQQLSLGSTDKTGLCAYAPDISTYTTASSPTALRFQHNPAIQVPCPWEATLTEGL